MLECEHGGRHEHGCLLTVDRCFECCSDGNFGFAKADVATYQAVHRSA